MYDAAIGLAGALGHIASAFQQGNVSLVPRQQPCHGASNHTTADDDDVLIHDEPSKHFSAFHAGYEVFYHGMLEKAILVLQSPQFLPYFSDRISRTAS